jgi:hypothetical protein
VKTVRIPAHLLADEYHTKRKGQKSYTVMTAADGCVPGNEFCESASGEDLTNDLCNKKRQWTQHLEHRYCYRTSNMLDRLMRFQHKYFERGQKFHGSVESARLRCRAWALLYNDRDWCPRARRLNSGVRCPAERLNSKRYTSILP